MTHYTALTLEDLLAAPRYIVHLVRTLWRFQSVDELAQRVESFIRKSMCKLALLIVEEFVRTDRTVITGADQHCVSGDVLGSAVDVSAGVIDVAPILDAVQIEYFGNVERAAVEPCERAAVRKPIYLVQLGRTQLFELSVNVIFDPRHTKIRVLRFVQCNLFRFQVAT